MGGVLLELGDIEEHQMDVVVRRQLQVVRPTYCRRPKELKCWKILAFFYFNPRINHEHD
jgi:hypothetical protein